MVGVKTKDNELLKLLTNIEKNFNEQIELSFKLANIYVDKVSEELINTKVNNQLNSMTTTIVNINPKFNEKYKNYDKMKQEMLEILNDYEAVLKQLCDKYDVQIKGLISKKFELESELLKIMAALKKSQERINQKSIINSVVGKLKRKSVKKELLEIDEVNQDDIEYEQKIKNIRSKIKSLDKKIEAINEEKVSKTFSAMEVGDKQLVVEIKKPRKLKKVARFFVNRFNTYKVITKNVFEPLKQRIDEFRANGLDIKN